MPNRADFTYSITPTTLIVTDTGRGTKSVAEDMEAVLRRIEHWHHGSVGHLELTVVDALMPTADKIADARGQSGARKGFFPRGLRLAGVQLQPT
jgi:hypothetical protein